MHPSLQPFLPAISTGPNSHAISGKRPVLGQQAIGAVVSLAIFCGMTTADSQNKYPQRPNIILIMADDLGVEGLGCYGGTSYQTPRLNQLAAQGLRFTHAYSQPLCTNTRVQLMTGKYNNRNWLYFGILDPRERTFGHHLQAAGYRTMIAGKWQLQSYDPPDYPGSAMRRGTGMKPEDAGFDEYSLWHIGHTEDKGSRYAQPTIFRNGKLVDTQSDSYGPDVWTSDIAEFLQSASKQDQPFFVYYSVALPHWPMVPTPRSDAWRDPSRRNEEDTRYFKDMVEYTDDCVGRVVDHVDQLGLAESTMIVFYSDNGTNVKITSQTKTGAVQGGKGLTTNAGTHVPLIVRWTGKVAPGVNNELVDSTDFLPTFLETAGEPASEDAELAKQLDGISFYPQLLGKQAQVRPWVFCHYDPRPGWDKDQFQQVRFARDKRYKLYGNGSFYDVLQDPLEQKALTDTLAPDAIESRSTLQGVLEQMPNPESAPRDPLHFHATRQRDFVPADSKLALVWTGGKFTEGPAIADDGSVYFTDIPRERIMRFDPQSGQTTVIRESSGHANGLAFTDHGNLLACEGGGRRVSLTVGGNISTLVDRWQGKRFNSPNDVAIAPYGRVYFTDPRYGDQTDRDLDFEGVFFVRDRDAHLATRATQRPNGIVFSSDGKLAYVADNNSDYGGARTLLRFQVRPDGTFAHPKELFDFGMGRRGIDGMAMDQDGNVYATAGKGRDAGVFVFGPDGENLAVIEVPDSPTNCTLDEEHRLLYITAQTARNSPGAPWGLYRIQLAKDP